MDEGDQESVTDLDLTFRSAREGDSTSYSIDYSMDVASSEYSDQVLTLVFPGSSVTDALMMSTKESTLPIKEGSESLQFENVSSEQADFTQGKISVQNADGREITSLPITYFVPAR